MIWSEDGPSKGGFLCKPIHLISSISWHLEMGSYNWIAYIRKLNWDTMRVYTDSFSLKMEFFQHTSLSFNLLYANYPIVCRLCHLKGQSVYSGFANHLCGENLPSLLSSSHPLMGRWPPHRWRCHHHQLCGRETRSRFEIGPLKGFIHPWDVSCDWQKQGPGFLGSRLTSILGSLSLVVTCTVGMRHHLSSNSKTVRDSIHRLMSRLASMMSSSCTSIASSLLTPLVSLA